MKKTGQKIRLFLRYVEGGREVKTYKTVEGARKRAQYQIGKYPEIGSNYAADECCSIRVEGCSLFDLFPDVAR
jgi:hypothetical protein